VKMRVRLLTSLMMMITLLPITASAESEFGRSGAYLRGGVAGAWDLTNLLGEFTDTGVGLGVAGGYRMNSWLAVEGQYHWLGNTDIGFSGNDIATVNRWDTTANVRASTSGRFQPYALVGIGYGNYEISDAADPNNSVSAGGFIARFGGGFDIYITKHIAIYGEGAYVMATGDIDPFDYATLGAGAMWRF